MFDRWRAVSEDNGISFPFTGEFLTPADVPALLIAIQRLQAIAQSSSTLRLYEMSEEVALELVGAQKETSDDFQSLLLQYLQFETSIAPLKASIGQGRFDLAFDWIHNGLSDEVSSTMQREFFLERPFSFVLLLVNLFPSSLPTSFLEWCETFFYYCRHQSALQVQADKLAALLSGVLFRLPADVDLSIRAAISLMSWGRDVGHDTAPPISERLRRLYSSTGLSRQSKSLIAKVFSTRSSDLIGDPPQKWANIVIGEFSDQLVQHEQFQYLFATFEDAADWDQNIEQLVRTASAYSEELRSNVTSQTEWIIALDQKSNLLSPVGRFAIDHNKSQGFMRVLAAWYGGEIDAPTNSTCVLLPSALTGVGFLGQTAEIVPFRGEFLKNSLSVEAMNEATNIALGTTRTVQAGPVLEQAPQRPGQPDRNFADAFETALLDFYDAKKLARQPTHKTRSRV